MPGNRSDSVPGARAADAPHPVRATGMRDIARHAGASVATVSRVINDSGYVSAATRARVEQAIAALQFTPNAGARAMRRGQTQMVGVVLPALDVPFFAILAHTIEQALFARGYQALICCTDESTDQESRYIGTLLAQKVDGVLAASVLTDTAQYRRIVAAGIPIVALDRELAGIASVSVMPDHHRGGQMMAQHLLDLGHRRIAVVGAPGHSPPILARLAGALQVLAAKGVTPVDVRLGPLHDFDACRALAEAVLDGPVRPTAIIGTTDVAAIGVIHAAIGRGFRVPDDLSVIGFDDLPAARFVLPALTTVAQPLRAIGLMAVEQLCLLMAGKPALVPGAGSLPLTLIRRETTAVYPSGATDSA